MLYFIIYKHSQKIGILFLSFKSSPRILDCYISFSKSISRKQDFILFSIGSPGKRCGLLRFLKAILENRTALFHHLKEVLEYWTALFYFLKAVLEKRIYFHHLKAVLEYWTKKYICFLLSYKGRLRKQDCFTLSLVCLLKNILIIYERGHSIYHRHSILLFICSY